MNNQKPLTINTVSYDARAITINGQRTFLLSGAIHYPRSTPAMWPALMQQSRDAGLNAIETYVFWNLHERQRGIFDFSERLDLLRFCQVAQENGLYLVLRIGPYICAEASYGGLPEWLRDLPGMQIRTWNQPFMQEMERWVRHLVEYLRPVQIANGGPLILFQMENEYNTIAWQYGEEGQRYLQWSAELGKSLGLDIPIIMCAGAAAGAIETINSFSAHLVIEEHVANHPDQPALWTENWSGWYDTYGYPHRTRTSQSVAYSVARFIAAGGAGVNYYMWHGGTNFGREAMYLQTTSYDYDAPLDEYGFPTTKYQHLKRLHQVLNAAADLLLSQKPAPAQRLGAQQRAYLYRLEGRSLLFLCNDALERAVVTYANQRFALSAQSVLLVSDGNVLFDTAELVPACTIERTLQPWKGTITAVACYEEPLPASWPAPARSAVTSNRPIEQLQLTHDTTDYCWYTTRLVIADGDEEPTMLTLVGVADVVHVFVDGVLHATTVAPLLEDRGALYGEGFTQSFSLHLKPGEHDLVLLCCAMGLIKGDWMIDNTNMVEERKGLWGGAYCNEKELRGGWSMQPGLLGEHSTIFDARIPCTEWQSVWQQAVGQPLRWWRLDFTHTQSGSPLVLDLTGMQKGLVWLNGRCLGRYWFTPGVGKDEEWLSSVVSARRIGEPTQRYYHLPAEWLKGRNVLVLFEEMGGDPSALKFYVPSEPAQGPDDAD